MEKAIYFPPEVLTLIFSFLSSRELLIVSTVCRTWYSLSKQRKYLLVKAITSVNNLQDILDNFPSLQSLEIRYCNSRSLSSNSEQNASTLSPNSSSLSIQQSYSSPSLSTLGHSSPPSFSNGLFVDELHRVAAQFKGHPELLSLVSDSEMVLPGVLQSPKLMILKISSSFSFRPTNHLSVEPHLNSYLQQSQNICYLLNHLPNLKILDISRPIFWRRSIPKGSDIPIHCLRELTIRETSAWSLVNLTGFLKRAQAPFLRVFHLEVDLHLPRDFFYSLASGCTQLETLKLCHTKLAPEHLVDIAQCGLARSLKEISFHYVESFFPHQGYPVYKSLLLYLANSFPLLERLELVHSDWLDVDTLEWSPVHSPHGLKELVLFDLGEHYLGDIGFIASLFPTLISLKLHLDYRDFSDMSPLLGLTSLNHVELRCREVTHRSSSPSNSVVPLELEFSTTQLTSLIFWVPPARSVLLHQCLFPCCTTLTSLVLNYPNTSFCDLLCSQDLNFRQLRHLEIRALGSEGHKNGQRLLQFLGRCAPKLRQVHLECLHYLVQPLEASILDSLSTTHLNALHVQGFAITTEVLEVLYRWREGLKTLTFCGPAFDVMDVEMHTALCGLLQHTRLLNQLVLSVSDIELPSLGSIHPVVIGSTGFLLKERESAHKRRVYQCHLAKMYPWIEEISVWSKLASRDISRII